MRITPLARQSWSLYLLILSIFSIVSCQKEVSYEANDTVGAGGSAVFTLVSSGSSCSDATTTGVFVAGQAVSATDFVMLTVNVTTPGTWTYNTGTVNGFSFSGSGGFTATGDQLIALVAGGKPANAGTTSFPLRIAGVECSFDVPVLATSNGNDPQGDLYYKATIGGVNYMESVTATNEYVAVSDVSGDNDNEVGIAAYISTIADPVPVGFTEMVVSKGLLTGYKTATDAQFKAFFAVGTYPFTPAGAKPFVNGNGIYVTWTDKAGAQWTSFHATKAQPSGSSFKIVSVEDAIGSTGVYAVKVKMQFTCTLFKVNSTESLPLTGGEMVAYFAKL